MARKKIPVCLDDQLMPWMIMASLGRALTAMHSEPNQTFVIYDLETTGLYPGSDEFIQIAAMRFVAGQLCREDAFFSFAKPRRRIPAFIESHTGIRRHDARGDVELLGLAVERMWQRLGLDAAFTGVRRHQACLPKVG